MSRDVTTRGGIFDANAQARVEDLMRTAVLALAREVMRHAQTVSPVLTGRYRSSWRVSDVWRMNRGTFEAEVTNADDAGKIRAIEWGFPPYNRGGPGRAPENVFRQGREFGDVFAQRVAVGLRTEFVTRFG